MEYILNKETGVMEIWSDGKKIAEAITINDILSEADDDKGDRNQRRKTS